MRPDTKLKLARRKHTLELLKWIYARREPQLDGTKISLEHRRSLKEQSRSLTYGEVKNYVSTIIILLSHLPVPGPLLETALLGYGSRFPIRCCVCDQHMNSNVRRYAVGCTGRASSLC